MNCSLRFLITRPLVRTAPYYCVLIFSRVISAKSKALKRIINKVADKDESCSERFSPTGCLVSQGHWTETDWIDSK